MQSFSVERYLGTWFEIARANAPFEMGCARAVAQYTPAPGGITVVNTCLDGAGNPIRQIQGMASLTRQPGVFRLVFPGGMPAARYEVLQTDYEHYSIVGNRTTGYLSILCRRPTVTPFEQNLLHVIVATLGFSNVEWTLAA
jgi:apolipoprotein D and lipocalin family protein